MRLDRSRRAETEMTRHLVPRTRHGTAQKLSRATDYVAFAPATTCWERAHESWRFHLEDASRVAPCRVAGILDANDSQESLPFRC